MFRRALPLLALAALTIPALPAHACTIFALARDGAVLAGNNEDAGDPDPRVWVVPAAEGRHGRVCFGFDDDCRIAEGGMNDRGLFIDVNALLRSTDWAPDPALPDWEEWEGWFVTGVPDGILAMCADVDEALAIFRAYNLLTFAKVKYLLADRAGNSAIVEWGPDGLTILPGDGAFQVSTNFVNSAQAPGASPCYRYDLANRLLAARDDLPAADLARLVLSSTAMEFNTPTQYSNVYDLARGRVTVFLYHNFEEPVTLDLAEELARAEPLRGSLNELFDAPSYSRYVYGKYKR